MPEFSKDLARKVALTLTANTGSELGLAEAFSETCDFSYNHPDLRPKKLSNAVYDRETLKKLAISFTNKKSKQLGERCKPVCER